MGSPTLISDCRCRLEPLHLTKDAIRKLIQMTNMEPSYCR